jgi:hypothetical protein
MVRRLSHMTAALILIPPLGGCASDPATGPRRPGREASDSSTLGHDLKGAPRGRTIPPAGLGVDLVGRLGGDPTV